MKFLLGVFVLMQLIGCSSVTVRTDEQFKTTRPPTYEQRLNYWWWGLKGFHSVNVREVCGNRRVEQMQAVNTFGDIVRYIVTIGIYAPRSARIWCAEVPHDA